MKLIPAHNVEKEKIEQLLQTNQTIDQELLIRTGYVVESQDRLEGCFVLEPVDEAMYWLKQMYLSKDAATSLPVLLEAVLALAKQKEAKTVFVHSHQPMVDVILEALQFLPHKDGLIVDNYPVDKGNWWAYNVS